MATDMSNPVVCETLKALWDGVPPSDFDVSVENFSVPMVRLSLAATLHGCPGGADNGQYYDYVVSVLDQSRDDFDRARAAIRLGTVGSDGDVERLRNLALTEPSTIVGVGAVGGLALRRSKAAVAALVSIASELSIAPDIKQSVTNALESIAADTSVEREIRRTAAEALKQ
jgi:hypothetical protein